MPSARDTGRTRPDTITEQKRPSGASPSPARPNLGQREPPTSKADREHTTRRRGMLAGTIAALLTGAAATVTARAASPPATGDDAELLRLCAEFCEAHAAAYAVPVDDDEALHEAMGVRWEISDEIAEMPALTLAGYRAKAAVALVLLVENGRDEQSSADTDFALAALRDLAGSTAA